MQQPGLFGASSSATTVIEFANHFADWQRHARTALEQGKTPKELWWQELADADDSCEQHSQRPTPAAAAAASQIKVPRKFMSLARQASYHSSPDRWALLYSLLWRITHGEPALMQLAGDAEVARLNKYVNAINRDIHKMKAFVRFKEVDASKPQGCRYIAWFEPEHHIVEPAARFFRDRFSNMRWSILTPNRCAHWEGEGKLWFSRGTGKGEAPDADQFEAAWRTYYASIFNPARIKLNAMRSEMPQKYWKNLPEAHLIGKLVQDAPARLDAMRTFSKTKETLNCGPLPNTPQSDLVARQNDPNISPLKRLGAAATQCRNCALWKPATQTVFGEGPEDARILLLGEQPGDSEDLQGKPFVGPAGQLLNSALEEAGLKRETLYLTNVVKHFKFQSRAGNSKVRIHKSPSVREMEACQSWLDAELANVNPVVVVCLGATAVRSQLGREIKLKTDRGQWFERDNRVYLATPHPSFVLRQQDPQRKRQALSLLINDLKTVPKMLGSQASTN